MPKLCDSECKQGDNEGGGSSGWLQGEVSKRRLWEVRIKTILKDILVGRRTKILALYSE